MLAVAVASLGCAIVLVLGDRGSDFPTHVYRAGLVRSEGPFVVWSNQWYGGHALLPYSVLTPILGAIIGPVALGAAASIVGAGLFARIMDTAFGHSARIAALWFGVGSVTNLVVGRIAYAVGVVFALAAVRAIQLGHPALAFAAAAACSLSSPLAGAFLALAALAVLVTVPTARGGAIATGLGAALPIGLLAALFPGGGRQPYTLPALVWDLVIAGAIVRVASDRRVLRFGAAAFAIAAIASFAVPNPVGGNVSRLAQQVGGPILVAVVPVRRLLVGVLSALLVWCQWLPAVDGLALARRDPSTRAAYYAPVVAELRKAPGPIGRVEIPFTARHWETAFVAPDLMLARGWERQLDTEHNPLFYDGTLDADSYRAWLTANAVAHVALPDAPLDPSARAEAALIEGGLPYLVPVWSDTHWRVWVFTGFTGLTDGPAVVTAVEPDRVVLRVAGPGDVLLRVRASPRWTLDGPGCVGTAPGGWIRLRGLRPGPVVLRPALRGSPCPD